MHAKLRRLPMPPTTLSRQVAQLEDALQTRLRQRTTRKLTPEGSIRVAALAGVFEFFQMEWLTGFLTQYPGVQPECVLADAMADFIGEDIDVVFRGNRDLPDSSQVARRVTSGYLALAASANTGPAQKKAAIGGLSICLLPTGTLQHSSRARELVEVLPVVASSVGKLYVVYPSRRHVPRAVTAFVEMTVQQLAGLVQPPFAEGFRLA